MRYLKNIRIISTGFGAVECSIVLFMVGVKTNHIANLVVLCKI